MILDVLGKLELFNPEISSYDEGNPSLGEMAGIRVHVGERGLEIRLVPQENHGAGNIIGDRDRLRSSLAAEISATMDKKQIFKWTAEETPPDICH